MLFPKPPKHKKSKRPQFEGPAPTHCHYCGITPRGSVMIEKHHIKAKGMGGTYDLASAAPENEAWLCKGPGSNHCHDRAQKYEAGYKPEDLRKAKAADEDRQRLYNEIIYAD